MNSLLLRLHKIQKECLKDGKSKQVQEDEHLDEFSRLKQKIARDIKDILIFILIIYLIIIDHNKM